MNNPNIKLQGPSYYHDCYKWWDLNHSNKNFDSLDYNLFVKNIPNVKPFNNTVAVIDLT